MPGSRPSSVRLIASQLRRTSPACSTSTSPKTWGWRRISFWRQCSATSASEPPPRSSSSSARKCTWKSTSPSSSSSLASSPECAAAASSYASSTVCGTIERSSCSRSHGHSSRRRRVRASRRRSASTMSSDGSLTRRRLVAGRRRLLRRLAGRGGARRRRGLRTLLALLDHVALAAVGLLLPALGVVLGERLQRLLLVLRLQRLPDGLLGLVERLLRRLIDLGDLEEVVAELGLDRSGQLALLGLEDGLVELLLERALGLRGQLAALGLGGLVDRVLLRHGLPRLTALERLLRGLGQDDQEIAALGLREALLVLVVEVLDLGVGDLVLALDHLVTDLAREQVGLDLEHDVGLALAGVLEELLVVGVLGEALLLLLVEGLLDLGVGDLDPLLLGLALEPLEGDQQL